VSTPRLFGHRGALARAPENTLASLRRAVDDGADGFEFDVRATRDGVAVLLHDHTVDRTTNAAGEIGAMSFDEMRTLDAGSWFAPDFDAEAIPRLTDVLEEYLGRVPLALEMKETLPDAVLADLAARLRANRDAELVVASFEYGPLRKARDLVPAAPRALILRRDVPVPDDAVRAEHGLWGIFARTESVDERFIVDCRRAGLHCWAYTVNDPARAAELASWGIDGIISDDPAAVRPGLR
jgi:glycerophosphoryl diester phosphodiesterase